MKLGKTNQAGIDFIKSFEGFEARAYKLAGESYYTIGYGHSFDKSVVEGTVWTKEKAEEVLRKDMEKFEAYLDVLAKKYGFTFNENQYAALVSYCYNRGPGGLEQLLKNSDTVAEVGKNIVVYWGSAERYKNGLINRRKKETELFNKAVPKKATSTTTKKSSAKTYKLTSAKKIYVSAADAKAGKNSKGTMKAGTYYVFNESNGMKNLSTKAGVPGSWVNPNEKTATKKAAATKKYHTVKNGENLTVIRKDAGLSLDDILELNPSIKNPDVIYAGQKIRIK